MRSKIPDGMVEIQAGHFSMGAADGYPEERPVHGVDISPFAMDRTQVMNRQYLRFCDETDHARPSDPGWPEMPNYFEMYPDHPVVNVNYEDAAAYAAWVGKRLPTEAEWEYAARGSIDGAHFPWGNEAPESSHAQYANRNSPFPWRDFTASTGYRYTSPVGSFPPNDFGLHDMAGNVWEWCSNWFYAYPWQELDSRSVGEGWGLQRVVRGGAFHSPVEDLRVARRLRVHGGVGGNGTGFRCVLDLEPDANKRIATAPELPEPAVHMVDQWDDLIAGHPKVMQRGVELCMGCDADLDDEQAARVRDLGFTSVEQYVTWATVEGDSEGRFDFSHWDKQVEVLRRHGLKWVPFLIAGPAYSLPGWFRHSDEHFGAVCLEHRLPSMIQSIFDRSFDRHIERFLAAFAHRYRAENIIEALLLGITGDFGEAIYPVTGTAWTQVLPGPYHTHPGYWCGDRYAEQQFRNAMLNRYGDDLGALNAAWGTAYPHSAAIDFPEVTIPAGIEAFRADEPTPPGAFNTKSPQARRRWLDFIDWYRHAMNQLADTWMRLTRVQFPDHPIYLCTGGDAPPQQGAHFGEQCKVAARYGGGIRITNENSNYPRNFAFTRWVTSAGQFYGAYTGIEPAGGVNELGVTCRIFNAAVCGAKNLHFYAPNIMHHRETIEAWQSNFDEVARHSALVDVAFLYPDTSIILGEVTTGAVANQVEMLRDLTDLDYVDDQMVAADVLNRYRVLFLAGSHVIEAETARRILDWVTAGGLLVILGKGVIQTVDGEQWTSNNSTPTVLHAPEFGVDLDTNQEIAKTIREWLQERNYDMVDGILDRLYFSRIGDRLLALNHTRQEIKRDVRLPQGVVLPQSFPANSITSITF